MIITTEKLFTTSINFDGDDKNVLNAAYAIIDRIDDVIQNNTAGGTITHFAETYYDGFLALLYCLINDTEQWAKNVSKYINSFL